jgi:hypothetical protein
MFKVFIALFSAALLTGCAAAELVETTEVPRAGTIRYNNGNFVREKSRALALEKIGQYCGGGYSIKKEEFNPDVFSVKFGESSYSGKDNYMFIKFECSN